MRWLWRTKVRELFEELFKARITHLLNEFVSRIFTVPQELQTITLKKKKRTTHPLCYRADISACHQVYCINVMFTLMYKGFISAEKLHESFFHHFLKHCATSCIYELNKASCKRSHPTSDIKPTPPSLFSSMEVYKMPRMSACHFVRLVLDQIGDIQSNKLHPKSSWSTKKKKKKSTLFCTNLGSRSENGNAASNNLGSWKSSSKGFCGENEPEVWNWIKPSWLSAEVCDLLDPSVVLLCYVFVKVGDLQLAYTMVFVCNRPLSAARVNETNKSKKANGGFMYSCKERFSVLARNRSHRLLSGCGSDANTFCWSDRHWSEQPFHFF